jgi:hypothetical protein
MAELSAKELLEQMINGTHKDEEVEQTESEVETEETTETESTEEVIEDTDQETETEEEEETNEENDDSTNETSEATEDDQEEHTQDATEETEDAVETEEVNYKEFYEKVALAKFTANGREVEGFKNPEDLIRAQQMLHGYSDKMKVFKEYKKFLKPLEERGIVNDPEKFNLAMSLLDGDPEAIKKVLKEKNIDPMELDLEDIKYIPKSKLPSDAQLLIEETYEQAENLGVGSKFNKVISKDWDLPSLQEFVSNGAVRADLLQHLKDGTYDIVQNEIRRMELLDATGVLDGMTSVEKYRAAVVNLQNKKASAPVKPAIPKVPAVDKSAEAEKAKQEAEFKRKAAEKEREIAEQRRLAASVSKKKVVSKAKPAPKLEELKGDAFRNEFRKMLMS